MSNNFGLVPEFVEQLVHIGHHDTPRALRRSLDLRDFQARRRINAHICEVDRLNRLLLGFKDVLNVSETRHVQPQIHSEHSRKVKRDLLQAEVNLTSDCGRTVTREINCAAKRGAGNAHHRGKHLSGLNVVVIDGLLSKQGQVEILLCHKVLQDLCHRKRLQLLIRAHIRHDVDAGVSTHS